MTPAVSTTNKCQAFIGGITMTIGLGLTALKIIHLLPDLPLLGDLGNGAVIGAMSGALIGIGATMLLRGANWLQRPTGNTCWKIIAFLILMGVVAAAPGPGASSSEFGLSSGLALGLGLGALGAYCTRKKKKPSAVENRLGGDEIFTPPSQGGLHDIVNTPTSPMTIVREGDTPKSIAARSGCTVDALLKANKSSLKKFTADMQLTAGMRLTLPPLTQL